MPQNRPRKASSGQRQRRVKIETRLKRLQGDGEKLSRPLYLIADDCPKEELADCLWYEYARESPEMRDLAKVYHRGRRSKRAVESDQPSDLDLFRFAAISRLRIVALCPEFPKTPWLEIPAEKRRQRIAKAFKTPPARSKKPPQAFREVTDPREVQLATRLILSRAERETQLPDIGLDRGRFFVFEVDADAELSVMTKQLKDWAKEQKHRRKKLRSQREEPEQRKNPKENRGRCNTRDLLHRLCAYRILRDADLTAEEAAEKFPQIYNHACDWSRARGEVLETLERLFPKPLE